MLLIDEKRPHAWSGASRSRVSVDRSTGFPMIRPGGVVSDTKRADGL
jgi:hypothetical protein